jgi:GNAT superfamily N-acetyltransferase
LTSSPRVREGTPEDLSEIKRLVDAHRHELGFVPRPALLAAIERGWLLVAEVDGLGPVAMANWWARRDGVVVLYNLAVSPSARGKGIGRSLLEKLVDWAKLRGALAIALKCPVDLPANAFYEHFGFTLHSREPGKLRNLNLWRLVPQSENGTKGHCSEFVDSSP